jgi:DNA-directed RNA polymerase subunit E'/Rpb7
LQSVSIEKELSKELKEKIIKNKGNIVSIFNFPKTYSDILKIFSDKQNLS